MTFDELKQYYEQALSARDDYARRLAETEKNLEKAHGALRLLSGVAADIQTIVKHAVAVDE